MNVNSWAEVENTLPYGELSKFSPPDSTEPDSLAYPYNSNQTSPLFLGNPSNFSTDYEYDPETGQYIVYERIGGVLNGLPKVMSPEEFREYMFAKQQNEYWTDKANAATATTDENDPRSNSGLIPQINVNNEFFESVFGSNTIEIRPQGSAELRFGGRYQKIDNPVLPERNRRTFNFDFDQRIQMNVTGRIGENLTLATNYDTEATFAFENKMKLEFTGQEDDIVKKIEMGNVSLPVNSSLITGAQSLFGVKGQFQFGKTTVTGVFSEQRSQSQSINVQGGGSTQDFQIWGDQYEANRHFFLSQYFRSNYARWLKNMPVINSPVQITKIEVWVTNRRSVTTDVRNIVAFMDLGESDANAYRNSSANLPGYQIFPGNTTDPFPNNNRNGLNPSDLVNSLPGVRDIANADNELQANGFTSSIEYIELANARKLSANEFSYDPQLGYISLNQSLNQDEVLAVAYQYTAGGRTYQVGEFSNDGINPPKTLITKMLKSAVLDVRTPIWDLMMKNVYSLSAFQVDKEDFRLDVLYMNDETGVPIPFLPDGNLKNSLLVRVMALDRVNSNNDPYPDGLFDFVDGITIDRRTGRIFFPVLEPFGSHLADSLASDALREKYVFQELYDSTRFRAQEQTSLNKFLLRGRYKSASGSEISLNAFNIPRGSVSVTAGGTALVENQDYTVDYSLGRVKILNEGILNSGVPIKVNFENNTLFNFQTKTFMGLTFDHRFNNKFNVGGSILNLRERPLTQKVNIGDEPINNTIWGLNTTYKDKAPYLTRLVDNIPFIDTKESSEIQVQGEFAHLIPGSPSGIEIDGEETTYIDDFENSQTTIDVRGTNQWVLASTPGAQPNLFPEASLNNNQEYNYNRAKMAWYVIDPLFFNGNSQTPQNIKDNPDYISNHYAREVLIKEVFPNYSRSTNEAPNIATFDVAYYPQERGPFNFDVEGVPGISAGTNPDGTLKDPETRWGGIMRPLSINNFEEQNIEFIQFWVLDPYLEDPTLDGGELYFNLGSVSEDILKDGRQSFENGLNPNGTKGDLDSTTWGYVPQNQPVVDAFSNQPGARDIQDVGLDGMNDTEERNWSFQGNQTYLDRVGAFHGAGSQAYSAANQDPGGDNFQYYRGSALDGIDADILRRYKNFNNTQGNSNTSQQDGYPTSATNLPDKEDVNRDQTLSKTETYFQYKVSLKKSDLVLGENYITDIRRVNVDLPNETTKEAVWYQFKIPIFSPTSKVGPINDFRSIRFMRMYMKNFKDPVVLRFARLDLVRGEWRRYLKSLEGIRENLPTDGSDGTLFSVNAVNLEENGSRKPIPYVLPPGIDRQILYGGASNLIQQNEQSMSLNVCNLKDGDARAVFKNIGMDMRTYNKLRMYAHAEAGDELEALNDGDVTLFMRLGSDYDNNYYEYEIPLKVTVAGTTSPEAIWPESNEFNIEFDKFKSVKLERDRVYRSDPNKSITTPYFIYEGGHKISVVGAPNLSNVRTIMIGVRNPKKTGPGTVDDGMPKCAEVWVNELRLNDFDNRGGWAANARVTAKLADFGSVSMSGNFSTVGFGSLDQGVTERNKFAAMSYDLQTNFELGKFFPKETGIRVPMFFSIGEEWISPQFNPLDPDIEFDDALDNLETQGEKDSLRRESQDYVKRRNLNFTNVRKERTGNSTSAPMPWDIENWSVSYSFSETFRRNINTIADRKVDHKGALNYNYTTSAPNVQPFKSIKSDYLALIRDFNFYYLPSRFNFRGELNRTYGEMQSRNTDNAYFQLPKTFNKQFTFDRTYNLNFDLSKSLKMDYNAIMNTWIDEIPNVPNDYNGVQGNNSEVIWNNIKAFGRPRKYHQTVNLNWQIPINKLPFLDFISSSIRYTTDYDWQTGSQVALREEVDSLNFGNTIQNNRSIQFQGTLNFTNLYNKIPYLKKVNMGIEPSNSGGRRGVQLRSRGGIEEESPDGKDDGSDPNKLTTFDKIMRGTSKFLMMVKSASGSYTQAEGTLLPGFTPRPYYLGLNTADGMNMAPGLDFVFGSQVDIANRAAENGWLTPSQYLNTQLSYTSVKTINYRGTIEPLTDFRIDITAQWTSGMDSTLTFRNNPIPGNDLNYEAFNPFIRGNFSTSIISIGSAFEVSNEDNDYASEVFDQFKEYRLTMSRRLATQRADTSSTYIPNFIDIADSSRYGYDGYSVISQDVLIPAFLAAYGGYDPNNIDMKNPIKFPLPNWRITYNGLTKYGAMKKVFQSFTLSHSYKSLYSMSGFQTNLLKSQRLQDDPTDDLKNDNQDYLSDLQINSVSIVEQFSPLIGVNFRLKNNASFKVEYNKDRNMALSLTNNQMTDTRGHEITFGIGYIFKDVKFNLIRMGASKKPVSSNLELKFDLSIRDNQTVIRKILENQNQVTAGQRVLTGKFSAEYQLSSKITARLYYDHVASTFKTSQAFPTVNSNGGISIRLNLGQ